VIISANWRDKHKEIDIIAMDDDTLVFVEVKTRSENFWGNPEEFVSRKKTKIINKCRRSLYCRNRIYRQ
jgi:putative endonuclease